MCPIDGTAFVVSGKIGIPLTGLTTPVWWLSVCNRYVIEVFGGVFVLSFCFLEFYVSVRTFVIGLS